MEQIRFGSARGRWVIAAAVLGSGIAFLDGSVVHTALPKIRDEFGSGLTGQQWIVTGYLLTLGSLLVVGGSLGDRIGRRKVFVIGLIAFSVTSVLCGVAPSVEILVFSRIAQGVAAALLVPGSLAMLSSVFHPDDRAQAIGSWSGLASASTAIGPFLGGWLIDAVSWRWIFLINPVLAAPAIWIAMRFVPETKDQTDAPVDFAGAASLSIGLAGIVYALIEGPGKGWSGDVWGAATLGVAALVAFAWIERSAPYPMVPLGLFRSTTFAGANSTTFVMWGAIGAVFFLLTLRLQNDLGYSALEAGAATLPVTALMLFFAAKSGALAQRIGPRLPMTIGPFVTAGAFVLMGTVKPGASYLFGVFPSVALFGLGLVITVAPLTACVLGAVDDRQAGVGSAINNAVARVASLLAIAVLPSLAGIVQDDGVGMGSGFARAMLICAALTALGGVISWLTIPAKPALAPRSTELNLG